MILNTDLGSSDMFIGLHFKEKKKVTGMIFFFPGIIIFDHVSLSFITEFYGEEVKKEKNTERRQRSAFW